jgi:hypothetical protein
VTRLERTLLLALPLTILGACYLAICLRFGTAWPFGAPVHESGTRDLLATILFFDHALGELPLDLLLGASVAGAMLRFLPPRRTQQTRRAGWLWAWIALGTDTLVAAGSLWTAGWSVTRLRLLQYLTRPGATPRLGSHWRYHLLSQAGLMALPLALLGLLGRLQRRPVHSEPGTSRLLAASWIVFAGLSLAFGLTVEPFRSSLYLGHQARELLTSALVTVPLALAACLPLADRTQLRPGRPLLSYAAAAFCLAVGLYLFIGVRATGAASLAQSADLVRVLCGHFFEHSLGYLVVPSHAAALYVLWSRSTLARV